MRNSRSRSAPASMLASVGYKTYRADLGEFGRGIVVEVRARCTDEALSKARLKLAEAVRSTVLANYDDPCVVQISDGDDIVWDFMSGFLRRRHVTV